MLMISSCGAAATYSSCLFILQLLWKKHYIGQTNISDLLCCHDSILWFYHAFV